MFNLFIEFWERPAICDCVSCCQEEDHQSLQAYIDYMNGRCRLRAMSHGLGQRACSLCVRESCHQSPWNRMKQIMYGIIRIPKRAGLMAILTHMIAQQGIARVWIQKITSWKVPQSPKILSQILQALSCQDVSSVNSHSRHVEPREAFGSLRRLGFGRSWLRCLPIFWILWSRSSQVILLILFAWSCPHILWVQTIQGCCPSPD